MKKVVISIVLILVIVLSLSVSVFASTVYVDHDMETTFNQFFSGSPVKGYYLPGSIFRNYITGETFLSVAVDQTGTCNTYMKGQNGVYNQSYGNTINNNMVDSGPCYISGCTVAEYVEFMAIRYTNVNGTLTSQSWTYHIY